MQILCVYTNTDSGRRKYFMMLDILNSQFIEIDRKLYKELKRVAIIENYKVIPCVKRNETMQHPDYDRLINIRREKALSSARQKIDLSPGIRKILAAGITCG